MSKINSTEFLYIIISRTLEIEDSLCCGELQILFHSKYVNE